VVQIYNDGFHLIERDSACFCRNIIRTRQSSREQTISHDYFGNVATVFPSKREDEFTMYVNYGNRLTEVNLLSKDFKKLLETHPDFCKTIIEKMKQDIESIEKSGLI